MNINILENFYKEPESIISMLDNDYPISGCGTGNRSIPLQQMNPKLYERFCDKIFHIHNLKRDGLHLTSFFMEHKTNLEDDVFSKRWVHIDGKNPDVCLMTMDEYKLVLCGQILLTPNPDPEAGIKMYDLKPEVKWTERELIDNCINNYTLPKSKYDAGMISLEEYKKIHEEYHNNFELTCEVKNVYNRMVSWKAGTLHGEPMTKKMEKRLTQYFFIQRI